MPTAERGGRGPNQSQLPHVSEEAAATAEVTGGTAPEIQEQSAPVQEVRRHSCGGIEFCCDSNVFVADFEPR